MKVRILLIVLTGILIGIGALLFLKPAMLAIACPSCAGFDHIEGNIYVENSMESSQREAVAIHLQNSIRKVEVFFNGLTASPLVFACSTEQCYRFLGGKTAKGAAFGATAIRLSPRGLDNDIAAHELAHIELHARLGMWATIFRLPAWFDEGVAVLVSQDQDYINYSGTDELTGTEVRKLISLGQWNDAAKEGGAPIYYSAYREVKNWYDAVGYSGLMELIERLRNGEDFSEIAAFE